MVQVRYTSNIVKSPKIRAAGWLLVFFASTLIVHAAEASPSEQLSGTQCIHSQKRVIAEGRNHGPRHWVVTASIRNNGSCRTWLLSMDFCPSGTLKGSSRWGWRVPAGGHLSRRFTMNAQDESAGSDRSFYGAVGKRVKAIKLIMSNEERIVIRPKLPSLGPAKAVRVAARCRLFCSLLSDRRARTYREAFQCPGRSDRRVAGFGRGILLAGWTGDRMCTD
jgi:hypothetical protein